MDSKKAGKAKTKAKARSRQTTDGSKEAAHALAMHQLASQMAGINPEVQASNVAMQNVTQTVSPYRELGAKQPNYYNPGNVVGGGYVPGS